MAIKSTDEFISRFHQAWGDGPEFKVSTRVIQKIAEQVNEINHLTYGFFIELAREVGVRDSEVIARVVKYFSDTQILKLEFEFIDDDDVVYPVDLASVSEARHLGRFINPVTGEVEEDFEDKLLVYFSASPEVRKIFSRA